MPEKSNVKDISEKLHASLSYNVSRLTSIRAFQFYT